MSQSPLMEVKDLRVWYNSYRGYAKVLDGVDLHIHRGEKIGLVGEAGCGKTTTMKALMHLLPERTAKIPTGELFLEGQALNPMPEKERAALLRRHISMVFQEPASALNPVFTIGAHMVDVVRSAEAAKGVRLSKKEGLERAAEALAQVLIPDPARILTCYPNQLSGGMKQRVCIAMAGMAQRDLLIADEPGSPGRFHSGQGHQYADAVPPGAGDDLPVHHPRSESDAKHCRPDRHSLSGQGVRGGGYPHLLHHPPASLHADAALGHPGGIRFKLHAPYFTPEELALFLGGTAQKFVGD